MLKVLLCVCVTPCDVSPYVVLPARMRCSLWLNFFPSKPLLSAEIKFLLPFLKYFFFNKVRFRKDGSNYTIGLLPVNGESWLKNSDLLFLIIGSHVISVKPHRTKINVCSSGNTASVFPFLLFHFISSSYLITWFPPKSVSGLRTFCWKPASNWKWSKGREQKKP